MSITRSTPNSCLQAGRDLERAAERADVLAEQQHALVLAQRHAQGVGDRLEVGAAPSARPRSRSTAPRRGRAARLRRRRRRLRARSAGSGSAPSPAPPASRARPPRAPIRSIASTSTPSARSRSRWASSGSRAAQRASSSGGHVGGVVVRAVAVHPHRVRGDQRRAAAGERALARLAGRLEDRLDVVAVDRDRGDAVDRRALERVDDELARARRRVGVAVVLEHEDHRHAPQAGEVHRLVPVADRGRAVAEEAQRAALLAAQLEGPRHADRDRHHVGRASRPCRRRRAAPRRNARCRRGRATPRRRGRGSGARIALAVVPRTRCAPRSRISGQTGSVGPEREGRADRRRLLAAPVVEGAGDLALLVEAQAAFLDRRA